MPEALTLLETNTTSAPWHVGDKNKRKKNYQSVNEVSLLLCCKSLCWVLFHYAECPSSFLVYWHAETETLSNLAGKFNV